MKTLIYTLTALASLTFSITAHANMKQIKLSWTQTSSPATSLNNLVLKNEVVQISVDSTVVSLHENPIRLVGHFDAIKTIKNCIAESQAIGPRGQLSVVFRVPFEDSKKIARLKTNTPIDLPIPRTVECDRQPSYSRTISHSFKIARSPSSVKTFKSPQIAAELNSSCKRQGGVFKHVQSIQSNLVKNSSNTYLVSADIVCFFK